MNFTYNATFDILDEPIIRFPNQCEAEHRILVLLKCFMIFTMDHMDPDMVLVQRIQNYLVKCYVAVCFVMVALSADLIWKAVPMMLFCYACQLQKLFRLEDNLRRCISYLGFVFCCLEFASFEFVYDFYFILCFLFKSVYSLTQYKDLDQKERSGLQRVSMLLYFIVEMLVVLIPDQVVFWSAMFMNAVVAASHCVHIKNTRYIFILYISLTQMILYEFWFGKEINKVVGDSLDSVKDIFVNIVSRFSLGGIIQ